MGQTIRVSLPTYNALTATSPDQFALLADSDNILIKEFTRGTASIGTSSNTTITHNLGYVPFVLAHFSLPSYDANQFFWICDANFNSGGAIEMYITSTTVYLKNWHTVYAASVKYFIFYDAFV